MLTLIALTALETHWGTHENTRFLGEWCKIDSRQHIWSSYSTTVLSKRWSDPNESLSAMGYVTNAGKELAASLGRRLEEVYALGLDERFYCKMLGPWAISFASTLYDRWLAVKDACYAISNPIFLTADKPDDVTPDYDLISQMRTLSQSDVSNLQLFSLIIDFLQLRKKCFPCTWERATLSIKKRKYSSLKSRLLYSLYYKLQNFIKWNFYIINSVYHPIKYIDLLKKTKYRLVYDNIQEWPDISIHLDSRLRSRMLDLPEEDEFSRLLSYCAPRYLPWGLAEGMPAHVEAARKHPARQARAFLSCFTPYSNLPAQYVSVLAQTPIGIYTHSAFLHNDISTPMEECLADKHFPILANPVYYPKLPAVNTKKQVLIPLSGMYRYLLRISTYAQPLFTDLAPKVYCPFLATVDPRIPLAVRKYVSEYGWEYCDWETLYPHILVHSPKDIPYHQAMAEAKMIVSGNCWSSAVPVDALAYNKPTILIGLPYLQNIIPRAIPAVEALKNAEILFDDPEQAARKLNEVYDDAEDWWASSEIQHARNIFTDILCPSADNWERKWLNELQRMDQDFQSEITKPS
jgi:hypothetical protein